MRRQCARQMQSKKELRKFGEAVREKRAELRVSQVDLARLVGISNKTLFNIEAGNNWPSLPVYAALCRHLALPTPPLLS